MYVEISESIRNSETRRALLALETTCAAVRGLIDALGDPAVVTPYLPQLDGQLKILAMSALAADIAKKAASEADTIATEEAPAAS